MSVRRSVLGALLACATAAACSSTETAAPVAAEDAGAEEAGPPDAGRKIGCPGETPQTYPWQAPAAPEPAACTESDLSALAKAIASKSIVVESDIAAALGPSCAACAIGRLGDTSWRAVVGDHEGYVGNVGGCVMLLGANEACGRATDRLSTCLIIGCAGCADRRAQDTCADELTTVDGACAGALQTMRKECPAKAVSAAFASDGACQSFVETIRLFCGPSAADAGG